MLEQLDWVQVDSANLAAVAHEDDTIYVMFHGGEIYKYMPRATFKGSVMQDYLDMLEEESAGKFFRSVILPNYHSERLQ